MEDTQEEKRTKILANGAVYDLDEKRIIANPGGGTAAITQANASAMAKKRWEQYRRAAVRRIVGEAQSIDADVQTPADAFGLVAAKQYTTLMDSDKPRIADLEKLGQIMTGMSAEPRRENAADAPNSGITAPPSQLLELMRLMEGEVQNRVDQARAVDAVATDIRNDK